MSPPTSSSSIQFLNVGSLVVAIGCKELLSSGGMMCGMVSGYTGAVCTLDSWIVGVVVVGTFACHRLLVGVWVPTLNSVGMVVDRLVDCRIRGLGAGNIGGEMIDGLALVIALLNIVANSCRAVNWDGKGCFTNPIIKNELTIYVLTPFLDNKTTYIDLNKIWAHIYSDYKCAQTNLIHQWIYINIEKGITHFKNMHKSIYSM